MKNMIRIMFCFLLCANVYAANPASQEYVQQYVQSQIEKIPAGAQGPAGPIGPIGLPGPPGPVGPSGLIDFADFYALMIPDNSTPIAPGGDIEFPLNGPAALSGTITRISPTQFNLATIGIYQVMFQVSVTEPAQLDLTLNGLEQLATVVGRGSGTSQIVGVSLIQTTTINSIITVRNPSADSTVVTLTPAAGGTLPVSAHLIITRLQ